MREMLATNGRTYGELRGKREFHVSIARFFDRAQNDRRCEFFT